MPAEPSGYGTSCREEVRSWIAGRIEAVLGGPISRTVELHNVTVKDTLSNGSSPRLQIKEVLRLKRAGVLTTASSG